ncbi:hypothetical protein [Vibrio quintilis]|uniref:Uncharacterized protein n=1 Tax=Vibrio quintilis TaxID=1117707 RepID=A0A1M7YUC1_9VIBR|nr:hypothetical protein [Vibrio quintilis]SHO56151.1 hypothetical protein VQ7734_01918 [Vibrio quintilis]
MIGIISAALNLVKLTGLDETIGHWLGGEKGEEVASKVVDMAQSLTGGDSPVSALNSLKNNPELLLKFKRQLNDHITELKRLENEERANARAMQIAALANQDKFSKRFIYLFAIVWSVFSFGYIAAITFLDIPPASTRFADTELGFLLGTAMAGIFSFFYGSSENEGVTRRTQQQLDIHQQIQK